MKIFIILLSVFFASPAWAEWTVVLKNNKLTMYLYLDLELDTWQKTGDSSVRFFSMVDLKKKDSNGVRSFMAVEEMDCVGKRNRVLELTTYDGQMGSGTVVETTGKPFDWYFVAPETASAIKREVACDILLPKLK